MSVYLTAIIIYFECKVIKDHFPLELFTVFILAGYTRLKFNTALVRCYVRCVCVCLCVWVTVCALLLLYCMLKCWYVFEASVYLISCELWMCVCRFGGVGIKMMRKTPHSPQSHSSNYSLVFSGFGPEVNILSRLLLYVYVCMCVCVYGLWMWWNRKAFPTR